ncbi:MAG: SMC-Scp complex subunit ScpB [Acidimicrobiia bacterium]
MGFVNARSAIESILFVTESPVPTNELAEILEIPAEEVEFVIGELQSEMEERASGLVVRSTAGGWRLYSHPETYPYLERFSSTATARKLSAAAIETLAVVAYRQPVARSQIAEIRGVDSDSAVRTLERLGFIEEVDRLSLPGNPAIYGTTTLFLEKLGLNSVSELPPLADHVPPAQALEGLEDSLRPGS